MASGCGCVAKGTVFQEIRAGVGFKTGDFVKEKLGGLPLNDSEEYQNLNENSHPFFVLGACTG